jgi:hypothetical protein
MRTLLEDLWMKSVICRQNVSWGKVHGLRCEVRRFLSGSRMISCEIALKTLPVGSSVSAPVSHL